MTEPTVRSRGTLGAEDADAEGAAPPTGLDAVEHVKEAAHKGAFVVARDGARLAEMSYSRAGDTLVIIDHTWVDDTLRGSGTGRRLLEALVAWARAEKLSVMPLCPYARSVFQKDPSIHDVLAR